MKMANGKESAFEAVACGRCGGSGRYGPLSVYNGVCFGCSGSGIKLTKRGLAAATVYRESLTVVVSDLKVGQKVLWEGLTAGSFSQPSFWLTVKSIEPDPLNVGLVKVEGVNEKNGGAGTMSLSPTSRVRIAWAAKDKAEKMRAAQAYQGLLTKLGKPMKSRASAAALLIADKLS